MNVYWIIVVLISVLLIVLTIILYKLSWIKKLTRNISIGVITFLSIFAFAAPALFITISILFSKTSAPPLPEITYGEFPFKIEYEVDGEQHVIEDMLIAEFSRSVEGNYNTRARRTWNTSLASIEESRIPINMFVLKETDNLTIRFQPGLAEYYMGDIGGGGEYEIDSNSGTFFPRFVIRTVDRNGRINVEHIPPEDSHEVLLEHGIKLISWEVSDPILNSFTN